MNPQPTRAYINTHLRFFITVIVLIPCTMNLSKTGNIWSNEAIGQEENESITILIGHRSPICAGTFSPDDTLIATGAEDGEIIIWNQEGIILDRLHEHTNHIFSLRFSQDGRLLISTGKDLRVKVWDIFSGVCIFSFLEQKPVKYALISPDNTKIVTIAPHQFCKVRNIGFPLCLLDIANVTSAQIDPEDNNVLITVSAQGVRQKWDMNARKSIEKMDYNYIHQAAQQTIVENPVFSLLSPSGTKIVMITEYFDDLKLAEYPQIIYPTIKPHLYAGPISDYQFSPDGTKIIYATVDQTVTIWDIVAGRINLEIKGMVPKETFCPTLNSKNTQLLNATLDRTIAAISTISTQKIRRTLPDFL